MKESMSITIANILYSEEKARGIINNLLSPPIPTNNGIGILVLPNKGSKSMNLLDDKFRATD